MDNIEEYMALIEASKQLLAQSYSGKSVDGWNLELYYSQVNCNNYPIVFK
jgi:hypothetical protein